MIWGVFGDYVGTFGDYMGIIKGLCRAGIIEKMYVHVYIHTYSLPQIQSWLERAEDSNP